jgi:hypothetical protein
VSDEVVDLSVVTVEQLEALRKRNSQKLQAVNQNGGAIDPGSIFQTRFELFIDLFLTKEQRVQYEYAFETKMSENLDEILKQLRVAKLTQGIGPGTAAKLSLPGRG